MTTPTLSLTIPVKDEATAIPELAREIEAAFDNAGIEWECIWVDDGSTDGTDELLSHLHTRDRRHRYVIHGVNCGQSAALFSGFREARAPIIATLDGDGQMDPADLLRMLPLLKQGEIDIVTGIRTTRADGSRRSRVSRLGNQGIRWATGVPVSDAGCSARVFFRECLTGLPMWKSTHRFLPALVAVNGFRWREIPVGHRLRRGGTSKYGIHNRLWITLFDLLMLRWYRARVARTRVKAASQTDDDPLSVAVTQDHRTEVR